LIQELGPTPLPFDFWRLFSDSKRDLEIFGDQFSMGGDYLTLEETRQAFEQIVYELGGTITWQK